MAESLEIVIVEDGIDKWLGSLKEKRGETGNSQQNGPKIPRVSGDNRREYTPLVIGVGFYHSSSKPCLYWLKAKMVCMFVQDSQKPIRDLYNRVAAVASNARQFYENDPAISDEDFTKMLFLDGCFIVQFLFSFLRKPENLKMISNEDEYLIKRDLFLLENQLPFPVLQLLLDLRFQEQEGAKLIDEFLDYVRAVPPQQGSYNEVIVKFVRNYIWSPFVSVCKYIWSPIVFVPKYNWSRFVFVGNNIWSRFVFVGNYIWSPHSQNESSGREIEDQPAHLLELFHRKLINKRKGIDRPKTRKWYANHSAMELARRGIRFRPNRTNDVRDVKFKSTLIGSVLELPQFTIGDSSESLILNLIEYEKRVDTSDELWVTSYVCFMDSLIQDAEDVKVLQSDGIIINKLGRDQQVADRINEMAKHLLHNRFAYNDVRERIDLYYKGTTIKKWIAELLHVYFRTPWTFITFVAATLALFFTAVQTYLKAFSHKR